MVLQRKRSQGRTVHLINSHPARGLSNTPTNLCMALYSLQITILYKSITVKNEANKKKLNNGMHKFIGVLDKYVQLCLRECVRPSYGTFIKNGGGLDTGESYTPEQTQEENP